jgi:hypothetical protein
MKRKWRKWQRVMGVRKTAAGKAATTEEASRGTDNRKLRLC